MSSILKNLTQQVGVLVLERLEDGKGALVVGWLGWLGFAVDSWWLVVGACLVVVYFLVGFCFVLDTCEL